MNATDPVDPILAGIVVPAGTFNPNLEDPQRPGLPRQRKHATDLLIRVCQAHGIDYKTHPAGTPLPRKAQADLRHVLAMYGELVANYTATRIKKKKEEEKSCPAQPNAA